jgi:ABC-2 type transport system ATP-binding protein
MPDYLRASEFLDIHGQLLGLSREQRRTRSAEVLELVELSDRARDRVGSFSGGMEQRLVVAQAMLGSPELLILDEPTSALDPLGRRDVLAFIKRVHDLGTTVVLNSHILSEVESVCDSVAIIQRGSLVHQGRIADLSSSTVRVHSSLVGDETVIRNALSPYVHAQTLLIGEPAGPDNVRAAQWQSDIPRQVADASRSLHDAGIEIWRLAPAHESLEELFVRLVEAPAAIPPAGGTT